MARPKTHHRKNRRPCEMENALAPLQTTSNQLGREWRENTRDESFDRRTGVARDGRNITTPAFNFEDIDIGPLNILERPTSEFYLEADSSDEEAEAAKKHRFLPQARACDFCHKEYSVSVNNQLLLEKLPPGSGDRVCGNCQYKPPDFLEGHIMEQKPGFFERYPKGQYFSYEDYEDKDSTDEDEYGSPKFSKVPFMYRSADNISLLDEEADQEDEQKDRARLPGMNDCYQLTDRKYGSGYPLCAKHKPGDPSCWVGKDIQDIPDTGYRRYWEKYMPYKQQSHLRYDREGYIITDRIRTYFTDMYKPQLQLDKDPRILPIDEKKILKLPKPKKKKKFVVKPVI